MRKVLSELLVTVVFLGTPLAVLLALPEDGSIRLLPMLPLFILSGGCFIRISFIEQFFFEKWIEKWPDLGKPVLAVLIIALIYGEMSIVLTVHPIELNIPNPMSTSHEAQQALVEEFEEFR
jgi:hypothetical protein